MSFLRTLLLGVVGSFIGGFLGYALFNKDLDEGALQPCAHRPPCRGAARHGA
ncbi:MAG TPA: hypothetical protein VKB57_08640 [Acidimicrobiales bacterium]|nr:hypothetical protein [Acidimicrobiales bacterium]